MKSRLIEPCQCLADLEVNRPFVAAIQHDVRAPSAPRGGDNSRGTSGDGPSSVSLGVTAD